MSIKQGEYLKQLRAEKGLNQEQLAEAMGLSRQSISKWEQGTSTPDIDNFVKLSEIYGVPIEALLKGEPVESAKAEQKDEKPKKEKKKRSWIFPAYPVLAVIAYAIIGAVLGAKGWATGWIVLLTIPLFYTGVIACEKKKPIIFCYPVLALIIFLIGGFTAGLWHPLWIVFLTIPIFYIITAKKK
jgi:transcriptional regulator with XRE-family HTH domain